jgi:ABC-2 type transport system ATP-binding protein
MSMQPGSTALAISAQGLTKHYGSILALDRLDLAVPAGSIFGLVGPNGAGKSTALRILTGMARATSGTATVAGVEVGLDRPGLHRNIGYLDQDPRFYAWMTGRELIALVGRLHGLEGQELRRRVDETLERVGLAAVGERRIGGYSGGMRQRLGIGQALVSRPGLLVLDEPATSLDPEGRRDILDLLASLRGSSTVLFSSHILADVERVCDRVAILDRGRLVIEAALPELLATRVAPAYRLVAAPGQADLVAGLLDRLHRAPWTNAATATDTAIRVTVADAMAAAQGILPLVVESGLVLETFDRIHPTLEEVFLDLVGPRQADELDGRGFVRPRQLRDGERERRAADARAPVSPPPRPVASRRPMVGGHRVPAGVLSGLGALARKELLEQRRSLRLPLSATVFALVGLSSPLLARFTPEIVRALGGSQFQIVLPTPSAADAVAQLVKNLGQFGALTAVVLAMGSVATEKERGTAALVLSTPASRAAFLLAKLLAIAATLSVATLVAAAGAWFYTFVLFEPLPIGGFVASAAVQWLSLVALASITFLGSTLTRSAVAAAGVAVAALILLGLIGILPNVAPYLPTGLGPPAEALALGRAAGFIIGPVLAVVALVVVTSCVAWLSFRQQEL